MSEAEESDVALQQKHDEGLLLAQTLSPEEYKRIERRLRFKLDLQIVPLCLLLYFLSFLDRTNIGQAKLNGLQKDLLKSSMDYTIALVVLYPPYIVLEIPSNLVLKRIGPKFWIPLLVVCWGIVSTLQGIVKSRTGLYINRAFLGAAEAGILPGIAVYLTFFYKPRELQLRQALFFTGAALSGAFSGLLAAAIGKMNGKAGLAGWSWIFILEGIFTVVMGVCCIYFLPNSTDDCWGLTQVEKRMAKERLSSSNVRFIRREELSEKVRDEELIHSKTNDASEVPAEKRDPWLRHTLRTFTDPLLLLLCAVGFCCATPVYSVSYFSPTIVKSILDHPTNTHAMLMSCPPFACAFVYGVTIALLSDYFRLRVITALPGMILSTIGFAIVYASHHPMTRYGGIIILTCGAYSLPPALFTWIANNSDGHYKRATALALLIVFTNCGGLTSAFLFKDSEAPRFSRGVMTNLILSAVGAGLVIIIELYILYERRQRESGKRDARVLKLYRDTKWDNEQMRNYL
ncbi:hypothetical protein MPSI1_000896 [Malassezia psittaci]|uniref:Major facilitator superfamily (MFS) profile domain-containing protein n=1 Tax=Malassezia psittaci TaxID=1821823 RepID=A0AAF0JDC1_9BASI|nr:hypothetical protein MPSI1_000896 [Malassezia psittaci]